MQVGDKEIDALAMDISGGGMALLTNYEIPVATIVTVKFIIVNDRAIIAAKRSRSIEVQGEVRYCSLTNQKAYRLGVRFIDLTDDDRRFIDEFIKRF
jgi:c-di-GMP-binding flagellar brake protein YcgR